MAKTIDKRVNIWLNQHGIEDNLKSVRSAITKTANELAKIPTYSDEWYKKASEYATLKKIYDEYKRNIKEVGSEIEHLTEQTEEMTHSAENGFASVFKNIKGIYSNLSEWAGKLVSFMEPYVEAYAKLDDAMTNVSKYTGLTREEVKQLNEEFRKMDTRTPTEKLNALAADAGRLGITSKEAIKDFVEAADIINVALGEDLGEDAVKEIGKLAEMFGTTNTMGLRGAMLATGSAINTLAQSSSASERYLMDFTSRLSGAANQAKMTQAEVLGFASVLDQNKQQVEMSATAMQKLMMDMFTEPAKYAKLAGMSVKDFSDLLKNDANEALLTFFETLNRKGGLSDLAPIFDKLGLDGARASGVISVLAKNIDDVRKEQELANTAFQEGTSVINEAAAVNGNAAAQLEKAKKKMEDARAELGKKLIPLLTKLYNLLSSTAGFFTKHAGLVKTVSISVGTYVTVLGLAIIKEKALVSWLKVKNTLIIIQNKAMAAAALVTNALALASAKLSGNTIKAAQAQKALNAAMAANPFGLIAAAVTALAAAFAKIAKNASEAKRIEDEFMAQANESYVAEETRIKILTSIIDSENVSRDEKLKAIKKLQEIIPDYFADLDEEGKKLRDNKKAIEEYLEKYKKRLELEAKKKTFESYQTQANEWRTRSNEEKEAYDNGNWWDRSNIRLNRYVNGIGSIFGLRFQNEQWADYWEQLASDYYTKEIEPIIKNDVNAAIAAAGDGSGGGNGPGGNNGDGDKLAKKQDAFRKKLEEFLAGINGATESAYMKSRKEILSKFKEYEEEALSLGLGSEFSEKLFDAKYEEFQNLTQKIVKKYEDISKDILKKLDSTEKTNFANELEKSLDENDKKYKRIKDDVETHIKDLKSKKEELLKSGVYDRKEIAELNQAIAGMEATLTEVDTSRIKSSAEIIKKQYKSIADFAKKKTDEQAQTLELAGKTEKEQAEIRRKWKIKELQEEYDVQIELAESMLKAKSAIDDADAEGIEKIEKMIEKLKKLRDNVEATVDAGTNTKKTGNALIDLMTGALTNPQERFRAVIDVMQDFANRAADIYQQIADAQQKSAELDMERFNEAQDAKARKLQQQLDEGLISQKYYDAQMEKMEAEKEQREKKMKHEQFERERESAIVQALIQGGLAVARGFAEWGWPGGLIVGALTTAETAAQVALIASQVNPYAKGGYIRKKQIALVGEEGQEWVASNSLLEDKETAPVIAALDDYQRGNRNAMRLMAPTQPAWKNLSQSASQISSTFASNRTPVVHHHYQTAGGDELLKEVKQMNQFLADPKNRQAYISYKIQTEAQKNRDFIKQAAKL